MKTYRYRLYPTEEQESLMSRTFGCVRLVYNHLLDFRTKAYKRRKETADYYKCNEFLMKLKEVFPFLKDVNSQSLQSANRNLDAAFRNFFGKPGKVGYPKFKKRNGRQSFQCPQNVKADHTTQSVYLPRIGWVPCVFHRRFEGRIKTVTVTQEPSGRYFASISAETPPELPKPERKVESADDVIGIDVGITTYAVCSDNTEYENPRHLSKYERRMKRLQKSVSRKKKGSKNRKKAGRKLARCHEKIADKRKDNAEKISADIAGKNQAAVAVEDLNIKGMTRNHHLAKSINDASWGYFTMRLKTKCERNGMRFVKVPRFFASSQTCSACGYKNPEVKDLSVRNWICPVCGMEHDRDRTASINIQKKGYELSVPVDGGEFKPVETVTVDDRAKAPKKHTVDEAGIVLELPQEAPCL
ncbi:MAG: RNA-guided endonuclease TnpB family protein [Sphaerochaetaceae bacterium]|jgi:putative transposase|nr:RNA-guided endonuclease TnpB family protein [Sphaerochaetaceae bacterium]NLY06723.1 IS200/IS605 family element transposase accessory protein TnpB [Spirochaetales bacterium]